VPGTESVPAGGDPVSMDPPASVDHTPPPLGSWPRLYAAVILNLALLVLLFALIQRRFR